MFSVTFFFPGSVDCWFSQSRLVVEEFLAWFLCLFCVADFFLLPYERFSCYVMSLSPFKSIGGSSLYRLKKEREKKERKEGRKKRYGKLNI